MVKVLYPFKITGLGSYLPPRIQTSKELSKLINKSEDWIVNRTGVIERRISEIDVDEMGAIAAKEAIGTKDNPDLIINASGVPKQTIPDTSVFIQKELGFNEIPSFSVHSTCLSFLTAIKVASSFLQIKLYKKILIVSTDRGTRGRNFKEPESAALLGDAAAAVYLESSNNKSGLISFSMNTFPEGTDLTEVRGGGTNLHPQDDITRIDDNLFSMNGPRVYRMARQKVHDLIKQDLRENRLNFDDINLLIPHQASGMAVKAYSKYGGFDSKKVVNIIDKTGNCVAASIPLALVTAFKQDKINDGNILYLIGTGAGLSIGSCLIKF
ncbi:MAG: 3-oxoacyl-ACP synthase [Candidatus Marinimicrobia bacterium]|nr:3-oxoacyl-ACP synthase [Candidatus Neomarinimicrobiota bacterium]|tara:strand:+ start:23395 stop:24369 length:975 start_codon:yes stop_codon:yes gene_type:complete